MEDLLKRLSEKESELSIKNKLIKDKTEEIARLKEEIEKGRHITDVKTVQQYESKFKALEERIQDKESRITQLEKSSKQSNDLIAEYREFKEKFMALEKEYDQKSAKLTALENEKTELEKKNKELRYKIENLEERLEREIQSLKALHQKEIEEVKKGNTEKLERVKKELTPSQIMFKYADTQFIRVMTRPSSGIILILDEKNRKWILDYNQELNMIERKTAERQARSIARSGVIIGGNRVGVGFNLEILMESKI